MCLWQFQLLTEGADHGCAFIHHSCGKPRSRRGVRVPGVLSKLWDPVHELGEYPLHSQQFSVCPAVMFLCCWAAKVCTFSFVTSWSKFVLDEWILIKWIICHEHKLLKQWSCVYKMEVKLPIFLPLVLPTSPRNQTPIVCPITRHFCDLSILFHQVTVHY